MASSRLGHVTGRSNLESRPLIVMKCYFDGSLSGDARWLSLGGLVATDGVWADFEKEWEAMLRSGLHPIAPYVHMTDLMTQNDPFERLSGWDDDAASKLVWDAVSVLASARKGHLRAFSSSIDVMAHARLVAEGFEIAEPAVICAHSGINALLEWYWDKHGVELAHLFYDQNEPFISSIRSEWLRKVRPKKPSEVFWGAIANVQPVDMRDTPPMQAADIVAWAATRRLRNASGDEWASFADILIGNRKQSGLLPAMIVDDIDESVMRSQYGQKH